MSLRNTEFEFRTDFNVTDSGLATIEDIRQTQNVVDDGLTGDGITVAVMDSGIDASHPVFDDVDITTRVDFTGSGQGDDVGHGTAVAGTIAQLAPDVDLISVRIFGDSGRTDGRTIFDAYQWLQENSDEYDVVNMSWGSSKKVQRIDDVHNALTNTGVKTVVAAGNTGGRGGSPATAESAFSVGAIDTNGNLTRFSSYNPNYDNPDVAAVGKNNKLPRADGTDMGSVIDDLYTKASGTSFSAPVVSALVARALEKYGDLPVSVQFEKFARNIPGTKEDGAGIADYAKTVAPDEPVDEPGGDEPGKPTVDGSAWNFGGHDTVYIGADWIDTGRVSITKVEDTDDHVVLKITQPK